MNSEIYWNLFQRYFFLFFLFCLNVTKRQQQKTGVIGEERRLCACSRHEQSLPRHRVSWETGGFSAVLWVASRPVLVLPETPEVRIHLGSRDAEDTTEEPGQAGQVFAAPTELVAARTPWVGSGDTEDGYCHLLLCCPLPEGTSGEYIISPFSYAPRTGIVNPNSPVVTRQRWHIHGHAMGESATATATPRGSPRGPHRQFGARPLTHHQAANLSPPSSGFADGTALKGLKTNPKELETRTGDCCS